MAFLLSLYKALRTTILSKLQTADKESLECDEKFIIMMNTFDSCSFCKSGLFLLYVFLNHLFSFYEWTINHLFNVIIHTSPSIYWHSFCFRKFLSLSSLNFVSFKENQWKRKKQ